MLNLDNDTGCLKAETIGRGDDVLALIGTGVRDPRLVAEGTKQTRNEILHFRPAQGVNLVLDELMGPAGRGFEKILLGSLGHWGRQFGGCRDVAG